MNKVYSILVVLLGLFMLGSCQEPAADNTKAAGTTGTVVLKAFDAPFQGNVEHIYLNILEVSVHKSLADSSSDSTGEWIVLSDTDTTLDFLELVNGRMATLLQDSLKVGHYSQLRLLLGDSSAIVVDGNSYELKVPSGSQSGVKLNLDFDINADEISEIYMDFDASRSIRKHPKQDRYSMTPTFRVYESILSGTISGVVSDSLGNGLGDKVITAFDGTDSSSTLSGEDGTYKLMLLAGTYTLSAAGYDLAADTSYAAIDLKAEDHLTGYNFTLK